MFLCSFNAIYDSTLTGHPQTIVDKGLTEHKANAP